MAIHQVPSVGRVVHYQAYGTPGGEFKSVPRAAIVTDVETAVNDAGHQRVRLAILNPTGMFFSEWLNFDEAGSPGTWRWPPFVAPRAVVGADVLGSVAK